MALTIIGNSTPTTGNPNSLVAVQQVRAYWEALRPPGGLPHRDQIDPRGLSDALGQVFFIESVSRRAMPAFALQAHNCTTCWQWICAECR